MLPRRRVLATVALVVSAFMLPSRLAAQEEHRGAAHVETEDENWHDHPNHLLGFMGGTFGGEESAFTLGLDYTRQVTQRVSFGGFLDYSVGPLRELVLGPMVVVFPWEGLYLEAAPAAAREDDEWHFVGRLGAGYELEFGSLLIGPYAAVDLGSGKTPLYVLGVAAGVHF